MSSVPAVSLSLSRYSFPLLSSVRRSVYPSVYLSPSYVDVDRRQSGLLTLLSVSLAHLLGFIFMLVVKELKRSLSNLKFLIDATHVTLSGKVLPTIHITSLRFAIP